MRRREFLALVAAAALPLAARGQHSSPPVIGFLNSASPGPYAHVVAAFRDGLKEAGFIEGVNVRIEYRWAEGRYERLPALVNELIALPVAVIASPHRAFRALGPTIPANVVRLVTSDWL